MSENTSDSLIQKFFNVAHTDVSDVSLKFRVDGEKFEIELSSNGMKMQEIRLLLDDMIQYSIATNFKNRISAK